jgi:hypothetical protein
MNAKEFNTIDTAMSMMTKSERFRAMLLLRYNAPYAVPPSYREWGINE